MVLKRDRNMLGQVLSLFNVNFSVFLSVYFVCISWNIKEIIKATCVVLTVKNRKTVKITGRLNPFQSNFSANRILLFVLSGKGVGGLLVIILKF
jgi:hypothetical protein